MSSDEFDAVAATEETLFEVQFKFFKVFKHFRILTQSDSVIYDKGIDKLHLAFAFAFVFLFVLKLYLYFISIPSDSELALSLILLSLDRKSRTILGIYGATVLVHEIMHKCMISCTAVKF